MRKKALNKDILREIRTTPGRFVSIVLLIALGVFVFVGLKAVGPLMRASADKYIADKNVADLSISSAFDLSREDESIILNFKDAEDIEFSYDEDLTEKKTDAVVSLESVPERINLLSLKEGRMPKAPDEIVLDYYAQKIDKKIGDEIEFNKEKFSLNPQKDSLKTYKFKIVGLVTSPEYINISSKGISERGLGTKSAYGYVLKEAFNKENFSSAKITLKAAKGLKNSDEKYKETANREKEKLIALFKNRPSERFTSIKDDLRERIDKGEKSVYEARENIKKAEKEISEKKNEIKEGFSEYESYKKKYNDETSKAENDIKLEKEKLDDAKIKLDESLSKLEESKSKIASSKTVISEKRTKLNEALNKSSMSKDELYNVVADCEEKNSYIKKFRSERESLESKKTEIEQTVAKLKEDLSNLENEKFEQGSEKETQRQGKINDIKAQIDESQKSVIELNKNLSSMPAFDDLDKNEAQINKTLENLYPLKKGFDDLATFEEEIKQKEVLINKAQKEYDEAADKYKFGSDALIKAENTLKEKKNRAQTELNQNYKKLIDGEKKIKEVELKLSSSKNDAEIKIADASEELNKARDALKRLKKPSYNIMKRENLEGLFLFYDSGYRMDILALVFPAFFFLIAAIVALTAMTRMAEERRTQIGTYKALGYSNIDIIKKYLVYGISASIIGISIGNIIGHTIFTKIIFNAYTMNFTIKEAVMTTRAEYPILSIIIALFSTVLPVIITVLSYLKSEPANLMRPKAPKSGGKILMERLSFIWKHLSFLQKVTFRNIFRYKGRMIMTILGVAGCMSLIFFGFAVKGSLEGVTTAQNKDIFHIQFIVNYDKDFGSQEVKKYEDFIKSYINIDSSLKANIDYMKCEVKDLPDQTVSVISVKDTDKLDNFISLKNSNGKIKLQDKGVVINNKLYDLLSSGEKSIKLRDFNNEDYNFKISGVNENYIAHYIYMDDKYYKKAEDREYFYNADLIKLKNFDEEHREEFIKEVKKYKVVTGITDLIKNSQTAQSWLGSLDYVIVLITISSAVLCFVVLYNLNNINISERIREISTIKVLGFYPKELTHYIYRETLYLSVFGIILGYFGGLGLLRLIMDYIVPPQLSLYPYVSILNYIISALLTISFVLTVMLIVHFGLKKTDMVSSLKAYE